MLLLLLLTAEVQCPSNKPTVLATDLHTSIYLSSRMEPFPSRTATTTSADSYEQISMFSRDLFMPLSSTTPGGRSDSANAELVAIILATGVIVGIAVMVLLFFLILVLRRYKKRKMEPDGMTLELPNPYYDTCKNIIAYKCY